MKIERSNFGRKKFKFKNFEEIEFTTQFVIIQDNKNFIIQNEILG